VPVTRTESILPTTGNLSRVKCCSTLKAWGLPPNPPQAFKVEQHFTLLRFPINKVFKAIKDQLWVKHPKPMQYNPHSPKRKNIIFTMTVRGTRPSTAKVLNIRYQNCIRWGIFISNIERDIGIRAHIGRSYQTLYNEILITIS